MTIRTADLGGDKMPSKEALALLGEDEFDEENPALGLRGLRFAFTHRPFFYYTAASHYARPPLLR